MKLNKIAMSSIIAVAITFPAFVSAEEIDLGTPIVSLMPHLKKIRTELHLDKKQNATIDNWIAEAPMKRKALEAEVVALRKQLRDAIIDGSERNHREELKMKLAAKNTRLIEMRSLCTRMLRNTLSDKQFDKVVTSYRAG